jgi:hypothetical protein
VLLDHMQSYICLTCTCWAIADTLETDNGLEIRLPGEELEIFSHITSVMYVSFPDDMDGGNLWLWPPKNSIEKDYSNVPPARVLRPKVNTLTSLSLCAYTGKQCTVERVMSMAICCCTIWTLQIFLSSCQGLPFALEVLLEQPDCKAFPIAGTCICWPPGECLANSWCA